MFILCNILTTSNIVSKKRLIFNKDLTGKFIPNASKKKNSASQGIVGHIEKNEPKKGKKTVLKKKK